MNEQDRKVAGDEEFAAKTKALVDESVESRDARRLSELNQARHRALEELKRGATRAPWIRMLPAGGVAAVALVAALLVLGPDEAGVEIPAAPPSTAETDFELLLNEDSLEMLEDLEFYSWLTLDELEDINENGLEG